MLNVITKKYIIKHTFGDDDDLHLLRDYFIKKYMNTIYPYPEHIRPVAMYWGRIQADEYNNHPGYIREADIWDDNDEDSNWNSSKVIVNKPRPGILLEEDVYYFMWDNISWIVPKDIYDELDDNHVLVGTFSEEVFQNKMPTNARVVELTVDENGKSNIYDIINDDEQVRQMSTNIKTLLHTDLKIGGEGFLEPQRYAIMSIMDEIAHRYMFVDICNDVDESKIYEAIGLPANDDCYEMPNYVILGLKNIIWELLDNYGYTNFGSSLDHGWLESKGWEVLAALRWESLSTKYNNNIMYAFDGKIENYNKEE